MKLEEARQVVERARQLAEEGQREEALALYADVLEKTAADMAAPDSADEALKELRMEALRQRAALLWQLGNSDKALAVYEQLYLEAGSSQHAVEALILIGRQYARMKQDQKALESYREALELAKALNYTAGRARAVRGIGASLRNLGRVEEGLPNILQALALFEQLGDVAEQMFSWNILGIAYARLGALDKAINAFQSCLEFARDFGERETAITLNNLGECYQSLFAMEQALACHEEGLFLAQKIQLRFNEADINRNYGVDLCYLGRVEEGLASLRRALKISQETENADVELQVLFSLAVNEVLHGEAEEGHQHAQTLKEKSEESGRRGYLADALYALGLYERQQGRPELAQQHWQEALFLAQETERRMLLWRTHAALAGIAANPGLADAHRRIAAEIIGQIAYPIEDEALREGFLGAPEVEGILNR